ncbi:glycosyltransferase family 29 protein [Paracoccus mutanolyticus]|uniref:glycosyltransferase family 29 protein n=1 Tax=Paracoccus mutanolyticus TaxID=1499308 RepID=UPI00294FFCD3|nr:glycosyltransferase family 29 protein [Paracoccus mutanolyticus]
MTRWGFLLARSLRNEPALQRLSVPQAELLETLRGKSVALVGNARALAQGAQGPAIDAAQVVIRINRAPMPGLQSHGTRPVWLALAFRLGAGAAGTGEGGSCGCRPSASGWTGGRRPARVSICTR